MTNQHYYKLKIAIMVKTEQTGLYDATNEHDACGVGMVVTFMATSRMTGRLRIKGIGKHAPPRRRRSR